MADTFRTRAVEFSFGPEGCFFEGRSLEPAIALLEQIARGPTGDAAADFCALGACLGAVASMAPYPREDLFDLIRTGFEQFCLSCPTDNNPFGAALSAVHVHEEGESFDFRSHLKGDDK